jgi:hypothetical protein
MIKRYLQSRDDLAVFISLATAIGILFSTIVVMWIWSSATAERGLAIP